MDSAMRELDLSLVFLFAGLLALHGKGNFEPSVSEAEASGPCWQDAFRSLRAIADLSLRVVHDVDRK